MKLGNARCQCAVCKNYFSSVHAFERHRVGSHRRDERRCLDEEEMRGIGMFANDDGLWFGSRYSEKQRRRDET